MDHKGLVVTGRLAAREGAEGLLDRAVGVDGGGCGAWESIGGAEVSGSRIPACGALGGMLTRLAVGVVEAALTISA